MVSRHIWTLALATTALALTGTACDSENSSSDDAAPAERYVRQQYIATIKDTPEARAFVEDDGDGYDAVTVLCGTKGQPQATYSCTATWGYADAMKERWKVKVQDGRVVDATRLSSAVESFDPADAIEP